MNASCCFKCHTLASISDLRIYWQVTEFSTFNGSVVSLKPINSFLMQETLP